MLTLTVGAADADVIGTDNKAIQLAIDAVWARGGGTVKLLPGTFEMLDGAHLRSHVNLVGSGPETVLRKCAGYRSAMAIDADYAQRKVTVTDARGFRPGMGVAVLDKRHGNGWAVTTATVTEIAGNTLHIDDYLVHDYSADAEGAVLNTFSPVSGIDVVHCTVADLTVDGNRAENESLNGCRGGGIYFQRATACTIRECVVREFDGDGISYQTTQEIVVEGCEMVGNSNFGIHPGTGSARSTIRNCHMHGNDSIGFFLCWRVQEGEFSDNLIEENGLYGISIGHKDSDNVFLRNTIRLNGKDGVFFRKEKESNGGHRNTFRENVIEDNGGPAHAGPDEKLHGCGVHIEGVTLDTVFEGNVIRDTRTGGEQTQIVGFYLGAGVERVRARGNEVSAADGRDVVDESGSDTHSFS